MTLKCTLLKESDKIPEMWCLSCKREVIIAPQNVVICPNEMKDVKLVYETQIPVQMVVIPCCDELLRVPPLLIIWGCSRSRGSGVLSY